MAKIYAGNANYVAAATTKVIHSAPCKLRGIIYSASAIGTITFYDNTSAAVPIQLLLNVAPNAPGFINFEINIPLVFVTGLTVVTAANVQCFVITEA